MILGVRPAAPGYSKIAVTPHSGGLDWAKGTVVTPRGKVTVEWHKKENGDLDVTVAGETGMVFA